MAWEIVDKEQFKEFLNTYPHTLVHDFYMDWHSWNDFRDGRIWPESMVAMMQDMYGTEIYKINDDYIKE